MFDAAWALVAAWALRGIFRMQTIAGTAFPEAAMSAILGNWAKVGSAVVLVAAEVGLVLGLYMAYKSQFAPVPQVEGGMPVPMPQEHLPATPFCIMTAGWLPG